MSYRVFFSMSTGLAKPITVPAGTVKACQDHVARIERVLGFEQEKYLDNPVHWRSTKPKKGVSDELLCTVAQEHNGWVQWLYGRLGEWSKANKKNPIRDGWHPNNFYRPDTEDAVRFMPGNYGKPVETEKMSQADAATFWHGLVEIKVPVERWSKDFYRDRMEHLYSVMRGAESEGVSFGEKALTPKQAAAVINIFSFIDTNDLQLDVPRGHDYLASSYDGGYDWCITHGAVHPDDGMCCSNKDCDNRQQILEDRKDA